MKLCYNKLWLYRWKTSSYSYTVYLFEYQTPSNQTTTPSPSTSSCNQTPDKFFPSLESSEGGKSLHVNWTKGSFHRGRQSSLSLRKPCAQRAQTRRRGGEECGYESQDLCNLSFSTPDLFPQVFGFFFGAINSLFPSFLLCCCCCLFYVFFFEFSTVVWSQDML